MNQLWIENCGYDSKKANYICMFKNIYHFEELKTITIKRFFIFYFQAEKLNDVLSFENKTKNIHVGNNRL